MGNFDNNWHMINKDYPDEAIEEIKALRIRIKALETDNEAYKNAMADACDVAGCTEPPMFKYCKAHSENERALALEGVVADLRSDELIEEFSELSGAIQVHQAWRDGMLYKGRDVDASKMVFDKLKKDDKILDAYIAYEVIKDFCDYILTHPHERLEGV